MARVTIFSWGYWGWGTDAALFVKAVDAVEAKRGFVPPIFADVRISRSVRALHFRGAGLEKLVGTDRYRWMDGLGNLAVQDPSLGRIKINRPKDAELLLDLALEVAERNQRILFFCACEEPANCHRKSVGDLVLKEAGSRGQQIEIVEWPGGPAETLEERVPEAMFRKVQNGAKNLPLSARPDLARYGSIGWGSVVAVCHRDSRLVFVTGPAAYHLNRWALPLLSDPFDSVEDALDYSTRFRKRSGYLARHA
jgi:hypothetical protein